MLERRPCSRPSRNVPLEYILPFDANPALRSTAWLSRERTAGNMSQSDEWQEEIQVLKVIQTTSCVDYSVACVVLYEFIITFDQEVAVVWRRKFTATSLLLLGIRWLMILSPISEIIPWPLSWWRYTLRTSVPYLLT